MASENLMTNNEKYSTALEILPAIPVRPPVGHKGTFGTVIVIGGCNFENQVMVGAPALTARAALRTGCGLVKLAMPASIIISGILMVPSATAISLPEKPTSGALSASGSAEMIDKSLEFGRRYGLAIGPGWGVGYEQQQILMRLLAIEEFPVVLDADGLNNLAAVTDFAPDIKAPLIITPHPGEFGRLAKALSIDMDINDDNDIRLTGAELLAQRLGCVVVLKGANTVVTDGVKSWVSPIVNPVLATAGTGDVLTGIIASLTAQHYQVSGAVGDGRGDGRGGSRGGSRGGGGGLSLWDIACWAVLLHGMAADMWSESHHGCCAGMLATELCDFVPDVLNCIINKL